METRASIRDEQDHLLATLMREIDGANPFWTAKLRQAGLTAATCDRAAFHARFPFTTKAELVADQRAHPPFGSNLTYDPGRYSRFCQTSGSTGTPLRWLDTASSWEWMLGNWVRFLHFVGIGRSDRVFAAFSFGPFLGFWTAFEAAARLGCCCLPGGGLSSRARLELMRDAGVTVLLATPTYAIRLGETAQAEGIAVPSLRRLFVAGEPGGSIPETRAILGRLWPGAVVVDHHGMTEIGPVSWQNVDQPRFLHILETAYIAEIIDPATLAPVPAGEIGELVLTNLGRLGSPLLRYRTGDLVRAATAPPAGVAHLALDGGILGRSDDMVVIRGINVWPAAIESVARRFGELAEFRCLLTTERGMLELNVEAEPHPGADGDRLARELHEELRAALSLRIPVRPVAPGTLPRPELKSKRWIRL